ncbi:cobaltochelatase subunit CobN [Hydrogenophilus thiooxidans]|uniref:cobaltochelatase subunit CobN n=1 Tax=Hydrogenophilus thiooxidans TaxID=2820326 RepID=UPI001C22AB4E|nr:cobaltochelatase subunit CobN [Hydrogenophilus thiooxidans]
MVLFLRFLIAAAALFAAAAVQAATVLFVATGNVPPGKFRLLAEIARPHGVQVEVRYVHRLPAEVDGGLFRGYDLVFFDTYLIDVVRERLARALPELKVPHLWLYDARPAWDGLPDALAKRLIAYYNSGGRANFDGFFASVAAHLSGRPLVGIAEPVVFPKTGVYHPGAPDLVFPDSAAYFAWKQLPADAPVIAVALHQQYIASMQTEFVDNLIARIESAGAVALPVYGPAFDPQWLSRMLAPAGKPLAHALINTQIVLNPEGLRAEFERLGIPVVQAMPYRKGDAAAWAADPQGVQLMDVPFYLAQAEFAGISDIQIAAATQKENDRIVAIEPQAAAVVAKALNLVALQRKANADKRLAVFFWNYPPGEKNLSASFMNVPRSLEFTLAALKAAGYATETPSEAVLIDILQQLLAPFYRDGRLDALLHSGLAELFPVAEYKAWLAGLPEPVRRELEEKFGPPEKSAMAIRRNGTDYFVIPRYQIGNIVILPQPPRGEKWEDKEKALYHSTKSPPSHFYLAVYLWTRAKFRSDAIVHYGTHGTQEWLPGKERGLSVFDYPMLAVGDVPVVYPYIADNIGEAQQAKRRGRATILSHQPPPFRPAGLHDVLTRIHDLLHAWINQDEGAVKEKIKADLLAAVKQERIERDMGWTLERAAAEFPTFIDELHKHLHELAETVQPLGLHTLGRAPDEKHRLATVLLMLGRPFWEAAAAQAGTPKGELDEALIADYEQLPETAPYRLLRAHLVEGRPTDALPDALREQLDKAKKWYADIGAHNELPALLAALEGRYIPTSYGGDPIKNADAYPTGRNLYGFDPSRVPTKQAWEAGKDAAEQLLAEHRKLKGAAPKKLTFSLWSVETMRHQGILEAQALWLMGVEPVWDAGGRVTDVKLVAREALGRPRVDVVLSVTGLYRDHFPTTMKLLAKAAQLAAEAPEDDNPVAANSRRIAAELEKQGMDAAAAKRAGQTRIFSSETGRYSTGLDDASLATDTWKGKAEGDRKLAQLYLARMQYAYGPDEADWGKTGDELGGKDLNLYAAHLKGTEGAVLSRTSNTYGMLTTDDPFQYLGGIGLAVRYLDGKAPELYISNLRGSGGGRIEGAARFLARELATRNFHPGYIIGLQKEGYAGTLQLLDSMNNFWGWTATAREIVRDDQWQEFVDVYVKDKHNLGLQQWFERHNPHALAQIIERMLEAARQGYWDADPKVVAELKQRYLDLARRYDVKSDNAAFEKFVGYGISDVSNQEPGPASAVPPAPTFQPSPEAAAAVPIEGIRLEKVELPPDAPSLALAVLLVLGFVLVAGGWRQAREAV